MSHSSPRKIAVVGSGIAGLSAAWRLSLAHDVTLYEVDNRLGGHAHTASAKIGDQTVDVDTGFIVYNPRNYPNFTAMLEYLGVETAESDMSFAASIDDGGFEYSSNPQGLFAQKRNVMRPRMWRMISDILRLQRHARSGPAHDDRTLDDFLAAEGYSSTFREDHILPMCAAIWSSPVEQMRHYPAQAFFDFFTNHGLLQLTDRPLWRTVRGGSKRYVSALRDVFVGRVETGMAVTAIERPASGPVVRTMDGATHDYDEVVLACHSDQALALLAQPDTEETRLLGSIRYRPNLAVLHTDTRFMPRRRGAWASWNYLERRAAGTDRNISLTYWMNRLQPLDTDTPVFVTLNPETPPASETILRTDSYDHPVFDQAALKAQNLIPDIQGRGGVWYSGAWLGSGFHEDGLQAGLAVAEALGAPARPWTEPGMTDRVALPRPDRGDRQAAELAAE
ncbi:NAD(P)/FAD-dependent oxidoreductase [Maricaulis sp. CAU 1757]